MAWDIGGGRGESLVVEIVEQTGKMVKMNDIYEKPRITGLSLIPAVLVFYLIFSTFGIGLPIQISIIILLFMGYILSELKMKYNSIALLFFLFLMWASFLFFIGNASGKLQRYVPIPISFFFVLLSYFYGLKENGFKIRYYIYIFIVLYFVLSILEIKYGLILPTSGKYRIEGYQDAFNGIPVTTFANPNDFASAMGIYFIYIYSYCKLQKNNFIFIILPFAFLIIILANSRGVLLSVLLLPLIYSIYNKREVLKNICFYFFILLIFFIGLHFPGIPGLYLKKYLDVFSNISNRTIDNSSLYRLSLIIYTLTNIKYLLIGYGPNGSTVFLNEFPLTNPHNFFLEILIDYGIIGLSFAVLIFHKCFKINISISKSDAPGYLKSSCKATNVLLCLYIIISAVSSSFLSYWSLCWFPIYLTMMHCGIYDKLNYLK
jgi:hypothetical protein